MSLSIFLSLIAHPLELFSIPYSLFPIFAPDVAFEIHSPTDSPGQIQRKRKDYQESGVVQVWFDLERRLAELIYPDRPLQYFEEDQALVIDTVPGFSLDLKELYSA